MGQGESGEKAQEWKCPKCGTDNKGQAKCTKCGLTVEEGADHKPHDVAEHFPTAATAAPAAAAAPPVAAVAPAPAAKAAVPAAAAAPAAAEVPVSAAATAPVPLVKAADPKEASAAAASIAAPPPAEPKATAADAKGKGDAKEGTPAQGQTTKKKDKGTRLCVKNLAEDMTQVQLKTLFEPYGTVVTVNVKTKEDGKCRGFAFVTLATLEEAQSAIAAMDKKDVSGKELSVAMAEAKKAEEGAEGKGKGKNKEKGAGKGEQKGKGKGKGTKGAAAQAPAAQQPGYVGAQVPYPYGGAQAQAQMSQQYAQMYQQNPQYAQMYQQSQQMQAAQVAQMQAMVQSMYLQAYAAQSAAAQSTASAKAAVPPGPVPTKVSLASSTGAKEYVGSLKSMSSRNGYGFIECPEVKADMGRDVYISAALLPEGAKEVGAELKFTVGKNLKGHPQATSCSKA